MAKLYQISSKVTILAIGCKTERFLRIVAPSLVIKTSPLPFWIILSIPLGPKLVLKTSARPGKKSKKNPKKMKFLREIFKERIFPKKIKRGFGALTLGCVHILDSDVPLLLVFIL